MTAAETPRPEVCHLRPSTCPWEPVPPRVLPLRGPVRLLWLEALVWAVTAYPLTAGAFSLFPAPTLLPPPPPAPRCEFRFSDQQQSDPSKMCIRTQRSPAQNRRASPHTIQVPTVAQGFPHSLPGTLPDLASHHPPSLIHSALRPPHRPHSSGPAEPVLASAQRQPFPCMESPPTPWAPLSSLQASLRCHPSEKPSSSPSSLSMHRLYFSSEHLSLPHILGSLSVHLPTVGLPDWRAAPCSLLPPCLEQVWHVVCSQEAHVGRVNGEQTGSVCHTHARRDAEGRSRS